MSESAAKAQPLPLVEGQVVTGALFSEPMRVETVRESGPGTWVVGLSGVNTERFRKVTLTAENGKGESSKRKRALSARCPWETGRRNYLGKPTLPPSRVESKRTFKPVAITVLRLCKMSVPLLRSRLKVEGARASSVGLQQYPRPLRRSQSQLLIVSMQPCCSSVAGRRMVSGRCYEKRRSAVLTSCGLPMLFRGCTPRTVRRNDS
jgi:hypothetical protein